MAKGKLKSNVKLDQTGSMVAEFTQVIPIADSVDVNELDYKSHDLKIEGIRL